MTAPPPRQMPAGRGSEMETLTTDQRVEAELAGELPDNWTYTLSGTTNTLHVRATRLSDGGRFHLTIDRHNPLPDIREFISMCKALDR